MANASCSSDRLVSTSMMAAASKVRNELAATAPSAGLCTIRDQRSDSMWKRGLVAFWSAGKREMDSGWSSSTRTLPWLSPGLTRRRHNLILPRTMRSRGSPTRGAVHSKIMVGAGEFTCEIWRSRRLDEWSGIRSAADGRNEPLTRLAARAILSRARGF